MTFGKFVTRHLAIAGVALALSVGAIASPARAQSDTWQFALTPYVWFAGIHGTIKSGRASGADFDVPFSDILKNLSFWPPPVMLAGEARYGRFSMTSDFLFMQEKSDLHTRGLLFSGGDVTVNSLEWTVAGYYRVVEQPAVKLDAGAGFRLWSIKTRAKLDAGLAPGVSDTGVETFVDPILALRSTIGIADSWSVSLLGDIGGFGLSSKLTWQVMGTVNYQVASWAQLRLGYRYLAVNREHVDIHLNGPIIGTTFRF